ncbi:MAG: hypothetical protein ACJAQZ_003286 [Planctomycetota bacterium]|jgi:hypothetical protein
MAAKKTRMRELPPMYPRIDVEALLSDEGRRDAVFRELKRLDESRLVVDAMQYVRAERGLWHREGSQWPTWVREHAERALDRAELLDELIRELRLLEWARTEERKLGAVTEERALLLLQRLMELSVSVEGLPAGESAAMAGLSGVRSGVGGVPGASGVEVVARLVWCVRRAVEGVGDAFWPFLDKAGAAKQTGRRRPVSPQDLRKDDIVILQVVEAQGGGPLAAKEVARFSGEQGKVLSASHVSKRKRDLQGWELLESGRQFVIADKGREWLLAINEATRDQSC